MRKRPLALALVIVVGLVAWYAFRPELLFVTRAVDEKFPASSPPAGTAVPAVLATGRFHSVAHETQGVATVYGLADGVRVLRLTDFHTSNGPDVHVYLVAAADARDDATVTRAGFVPLGALKGTLGDQNYALPAGVDLGRYRAVTVWCRRFGVNFGTAPLAPAPG